MSIDLDPFHVPKPPDDDSHRGQSGSNEPTPKKVTEQNEQKIYSSSRGETLNSIAAKLEISLEQLIQANPQLSETRFSKGTRIQLPPLS